MRAQIDRIADITVCLRPFRAAGPRLDTEQIGDAFVVHNYGHGGAGWSLSWGSGSIAVGKAMARSPAEVAVIGCGALGLTAAILAQRAGAKVTIYAREFLSETRSARATGGWSPDSRIALTEAAGPGFAALWEQMARTSFAAYLTALDLPGRPIERSESYAILDRPIEEWRAQVPSDPLGFASYHRAIEDLLPGWHKAPGGSTPFDAPHVYRSGLLIFNIADYGRQLMSDFLAAGGEMCRREFHAPGELAQLPQKTIINCPGYGARALWDDASVTPVRGQITWLPAEPDLRSYSVQTNDVYMLSRRDGIVIQATGGAPLNGYGDANETPDRAEAERAVTDLADLYARFGRAPLPPRPRAPRD